MKKRTYWAFYNKKSDIDYLIKNKVFAECVRKENQRDDFVCIESSDLTKFNIAIACGKIKEIYPSSIIKSCRKYLK